MRRLFSSANDAKLGGCGGASSLSIVKSFPRPFPADEHLEEEAEEEEEGPEVEDTSGGAGCEVLRPDGDGGGVGRLKEPSVFK